jgi:hypothetical protein
MNPEPRPTAGPQVFVFVNGWDDAVAGMTADLEAVRDGLCDQAQALADALDGGGNAVVGWTPNPKLAALLSAVDDYDNAIAGLREAHLHYDVRQEGWEVTLPDDPTQAGDPGRVWSITPGWDR